MEKTEEIAKLIKKQLDDILTPNEKLQLEEWAENKIANKIFLKQVSEGDVLWEDVLTWLELENGDKKGWQERLERRVLEKISEPGLKNPMKTLNKIIPYAAAVLLFVFAASLYYYLEGREEVLVVNQAADDIAPGGNKATLTLADGRTIELSGDKNGIIIGDELIYDDGTALTSAASNKAGEAENSVAVLTTPKGGQYQVRLPDGTNVWLNAASTLRYPRTFSGESRVVELEGEAYFDVAKVYRKTNEKENRSQKLPFLVKTPDQVIEVLGTQFNVSAYADQPETKTTLVEGSVLLSSNGERLNLSPGEQGVSTAVNLTKAKVDIAEFIAWKNNKFIFNETELKTAMNQLSRWYDLEIIYEGSIPQTYFYGEISRDKSLLEVLKILQEGGVNFRIEKVEEQNKLIVLH